MLELLLGIRKLRDKGVESGDFICYSYKDML